MQGILEQFIHEVKQAGLPVKLTIEIGCACSKEVVEPVPTKNPIITEDGQDITTENDIYLTEEIN